MTLPFSIMIITDEGADVLARLERALNVPPEVSTKVAVQLRLKTWPLPELRRIARALRVLTEDRAVTLLINDHLELALELDAQGLHLPAQSLSIGVARASLSADALLGISCHTEQDLVRAAADGADYALLSPIHALPGKAPALGVAQFGVMARSAALPVFALGGIDLNDVTPLRQAGAAGIAVMRAVLGSNEPARTLASLYERWGEASA